MILFLGKLFKGQQGRTEGKNGGGGGGGAGEGRASAFLAMAEFRPIIAARPDVD